MSINNNLTQHQLFQLGYAAAPEGCKEVIRNAELLKARGNKHTLALMADGQHALATRMGAERDQCWQAVRHMVITQDWSNLAGNRYTR
jgi:hypothetical protein